MTTPRHAAPLPSEAAVLPARVVFFCQLLLLSAFLSLAPVLVVRRVALGGAGTESPLVAAVLTVALGLMLRRLVSPDFAQALGCAACSPARLRLILAIIVGVFTGALAATVGRWVEQAGPSLVGLLFFALVETAVWLVPAHAGVAPWRTQSVPERSHAETPLEPFGEASDERVPEESVDEPELALPAGVQQQITRSQSAEGETALVLARLSWSAGQRQQVLHVAFCPPLSAAPQLHLETVSGPEVDLRATLAEPFGLRLEAKRSGSDLAAGESLVAAHALASGAAAEPTAPPHE